MGRRPAADWSPLSEKERGDVARHRKLVCCIASKLCKHLRGAVDVQDLIQDGTFGLVQAIRKFDPDRGLKFSTYAKSRVRGAMLDAIRNRDWVPRLVRQRDEPVVGLASLELVSEMKHGERKSLAEVVAAKPDPTDSQKADAVDYWIRPLRPDLRRIVRMRYLEGKSITAIAAGLGLTPSRVSQLHADAIRELRRVSE